jgi:hypothetical protein
MAPCYSHPSVLLLLLLLLPLLRSQVDLICSCSTVHFRRIDVHAFTLCEAIRAPPLHRCRARARAIDGLRQRSSSSYWALERTFFLSLTQPDTCLTYIHMSYIGMQVHVHVILTHIHIHMHTYIHTYTHKFRILMNLLARVHIQGLDSTNCGSDKLDSPSLTNSLVPISYLQMISVQYTYYLQCTLNSSWREDKI